MGGFSGGVFHTDMGFPYVYTCRCLWLVFSRVSGVLSSESGGRVALSFLEIKVLTFVFEPPEAVNIYTPLYVGVAHAKSGTERDRQYKSHEVCE